MFPPVRSPPINKTNDNKSDLRSTVNSNKKRALELSPSPEKDNQHNMQFSIEDVIKELRSNEAARKSESKAIRDDIASMRQEVSSQIDEIKGSIKNVELRVNDLSTKVEGIDAKVNGAEKTVNENRKLINMLKQDKLEKTMEIDGIKNEEFEKSNDLKKMAMDVIKSFGINIENSEIEHAYKREISVKKQQNGSDKKNILIVIFSNLSTKIRVMKEKRSKGNQSKIYFNAAITPVNRTLLFKAKQVVDGKLKVYFARGAVRVLKKDKKEILIDDESKLDELKNYFDQIKNTQ